MFNKIKKYSWLAAVMAFTFILSACTGGAAAEPTQDPDMVFTQVAETVMVSMTQTAEAAPPTPTSEPTATQLPAMPPTATVDPNQPTATLLPTQPFGPTPTTQLYGDVAKYNTQSPMDGKVFLPSEIFEFHICLGNIGSTDWTTEYYLEYIDGQKLWGDTSKFLVGETVEPNGKWCFDLPSIAPDQAGDYITRWWFKNKNDEKIYGGEVYFHYFVSQ
ncbi:MAG TPA: hypothetical protein G4N92_07405 [Anaerolineae bacterium]|nr:hypothetical protein [Anaerolineae bacterium]